jgi:hypothetical protein
MNSIVKKEQRNRALNTRWVRNAGAVFGAYPTNAPPTRTPLFDRLVGRMSSFAQTHNC